ncbi:alpha/beta fold hydrolase [Gangjinia marincola]|uniref:Alpha/beta fold hydrolase n=1 Tax=Gangjinia marincola TaxID=578463 RepID=A0ABP3XUY5_9FLAO
MILHAKVIGAGQPLLILHGFLGMGDNWKTLANMFAKEGFQVHLLDSRNHGRSFRNNVFNYEVMATDVISYCEHHEINDVILMGHSMGGKTAMNVAAAVPDLIQKLIIVDIAPRAYPQHHQQILKGLSSLDFTTLKTRGDADKALSTDVPDLGIRQFLLKNLYWEEREKLGLRLNLNAILPNIDEIGKPLDQHIVFNKPTLFIKGEKSDYITTTDKLSIARQFPQSQLISISKAGHWVHAENRADFYGAVLEFIT